MHLGFVCIMKHITQATLPQGYIYPRGKVVVRVENAQMGWFNASLGARRTHEFRLLPPLFLSQFLFSFQTLASHPVRREKARELVCLTCASTKLCFLILFSVFMLDLSVFLFCSLFHWLPETT